MMKMFLFIALSAVSVFSTLEARDLHLIDGRIFRGIQPPKIIEGDLRIIHDAGVATIPADALSRTDYYEFGLHLHYSSSSVVASSGGTSTTGTLGFNSSATNHVSSYSERSYSSRSYGERQYRPEHSPTEAVPASPTPDPSYTSSARYTRPPDNSPKTVHVRGYYNKHGTYVQPYTRRRSR
jgi:hypothetical protein